MLEVNELKPCFG